MKRMRLAALLGAGLLTLGVVGAAVAGTGPSDPGGITPVTHAGNIQLPGNNSGNDKADCDIADAVDIAGPTDDGDLTADATTTNGVKVSITYDGTTKTLEFTATGGLVTIAYVKGGDAYNEYDYADPGVASDGNLYAPDNNGGQPAGLSHVIFCTTETVPSEAPSTAPSQPASVPPTEQPSAGGGGETNLPSQPATDSFAGTGFGGPSDAAWLVVVALGILLASVLILTPTRAKVRR